MKKLMIIVFIFFTFQASADKLFNAKFDPCFSKNSIFGRHANFQFDAPISCPVTGTNLIVFWAYFNSNWVQIPVSQQTYNSAVLIITDPAMLNYLDNGGVLPVSYNWACWASGTPYPPSLILNPTQLNSDIWQLSSCDQNECISNFEVCINTINMNNPTGAYTVDFKDNDLSYLQNSISNSLNSFVCANPLNPTVIVVYDTWDYDGDSNPEDIFTTYCTGTSTFQQTQIASHVYSGISNTVVCHSKAIYIGCIIGYLSNGQPKVSYDKSKPLFECNSCLDICLYPPYSAEITNYPVNSGTPRTIEPPCVGEFNFCTNTDALNIPSGNYTYVFEGQDNSYLINMINSNLTNGGVMCLGGMYPFCLVEDYWDFFDGTTASNSTQYLLPISANTTINTPSIIHTFKNPSLFLNVCHTRKISIGCKNSPTSSVFKGIQLIKECGKCIEICPASAHNEILSQELKSNRTNSIHTYSTYDVYPNPANSELFVRGLDGNATFTFVDMMGRNVKTMAVNNIMNETRLNVADLSKGSYFLKITQDENTSTIPVIIAE